jgi:hypothetical protein
MKALLIGALAATAYSADVITLPGTYKVAEQQGTTVANCCYPDSDGVKVETGTGANTYKVTWKFATTADGCTITAAQGKTFTGEAAVTSNAITFNQDFPATGTAAAWTLNVPTTANGEFVLDLASVLSGGACKAVLGKAPATTPTYTGVYEVAAKNGATPATCCYPAGDVIARQPTAAGAVNFDWTFASTTAGCPSATGLAGVAVTGGAVPATQTGKVKFTENTRTWNYFAAPLISSAEELLDLSAGANPDDCSVSLKRRTLPTITYPGVYEVIDTAGSDATCCYPAGDVTVTQGADSKINVEWTFGEEAGCSTTLKGQKISASNTADIATKDVTITSTLGSSTQSWTLDYPLTSTADWTLDLTSAGAGCSVILEKKDGYLLGLGSLVALSLGYIMF